MPDVKYKTKEEMPEEFREHAKEADGGFVVNVVLKSKLDEFRTNNTTLLQERDGHKAWRSAVVAAIGHEDAEKFKGEMAELRLTAQKVKDGELKGNDAIQAAVDKRVSERIAAVQDEKRQAIEQATAAQAASRDWETKYKGSRLDTEIASMVLAADSAFNPSALSDIQSRARGVYVVQDDGSLVPRKGDAVVYSKKEAGQPMPLKEWGEQLLSEAPHFRKSSKGGGASGGEDGGDRAYGMSRKDFNALDPATRIQKHREAQARR